MREVRFLDDSSPFQVRVSVKECPTSPPTPTIQRPRALIALSPKVQPYRLSPTPFDVFTEVRLRNRCRERGRPGGKATPSLR